MRSVTRGNEAEITDDAPGKVALRGYSYGVRPAMGGMLLNVNTATSLFYDTVSVATFLEDTRNHEDDLIGVRVFVAFKRSLANLDEKDEPRNKNIDSAQSRTKTVYGFGKARAESQEAYQDKDGNSVKVWKHMNTLYGSESQPGYQTRGTEESICVDTNPEGAPNPAYFLAEDLYILPYQIYRRKIEGPFNSAMIKKACRSPGENVSAILHEGIAAMGLKLKGPPKFLQEAGVNIDSKILKVPVRVIPSPALSFSAGQKTDVSRSMMSKMVISLAPKSVWRAAFGSWTQTSNSSRMTKAYLVDHTS